MKIIFYLAISALIPFANFCSVEKQKDPLKVNFTINTVDGKGKPVSSVIVYEFQDCEYDFASPSLAQSDARGITKINVPDGAYIQFYAKDFLHESYKCFSANNRPGSITIYAAPIPTYVNTKAGAVIHYFVNKSGNCDWEDLQGTEIIADARGKATLYLPLQETYKIQVDGKVQCFQPDQEIHTLSF